MNRSILIASAAACIGLGGFAPLYAAEPIGAGAANQPSSIQGMGASLKPAETCLSDLRAFDNQMEKDGLWLGGYGYRYGYGYGYPMGGYAGVSAFGYQNARPAYDIRILVASAVILARQGQQQPCEDALAAARDMYKTYVADLRTGTIPMMNVPGWREREIAAAEPVTGQNASFRSDEFLGTEVRNLQGEPLGSVDDLVMSPLTGKIAYMVIGRGGFFGIDENYVPIPWGDFKLTPNAKLLVVDTTKAAMDAAPQVSHDQFATPGHFVEESNKVDSYWNTQLVHKRSN